MVPGVGCFATGGKIAEKGYSSFYKFKKAYGKAGDGMAPYCRAETRQYLSIWN